MWALIRAVSAELGHGGANTLVRRAEGWVWERSRVRVVGIRRAKVLAGGGEGEGRKPGSDGSPDKCSVYGTTWPRGEPSSPVPGGRLTTVHHGGNERFPWLRSHFPTSYCHDLVCVTMEWYGYIDLLCTPLGTSSNYSAIAYLRNPQITGALAKPFPACCVLTSHSLATASNIDDSSALRAQVLSSQSPTQNSPTTDIVHCL
jgi:hypothetical protein